MDPQTLFALTFPLAVPFWALMILAPGWAVTRRIIASPLIVVPPLLVYVLLVPAFAEFLPAVSQPTLAGLTALFGTETGAAAAWAHFVGFDLFVGRWMYLDARERGVHPLVMAPVLVVTILLAPLGLLAYLLLRAALPARQDAPAVAR